MCKNSCLRNKNKYIIIGNIAFASFISILIFIIFSFPTYAAKSLNVSNTSKIIKFFSLQSNLTATSKGLRIILKVLIYSGAVGTLGSLITSLRFSHNKFNKYLIIKIGCLRY